jgi:monoamine oxidase
VVILGAGIAGLTAAYEHSRKGYECIVLEASHRAGGRNLTVRHGSLIDEIGNPQTCQFDPDPDLYLNMGPARIPGHHTTLLDYCRELGVALAPFVNQNRNAWVQDDAAFGGKPMRNREYVTDARGFLAELSAKCIGSGRLDDVVTKDEAERVIDFLRAFGDLDRVNTYKGSERAGLVSTDYAMAPQLKSTRQFSELLKTHLWQIVMSWDEAEDQAAMMMEPVGGMDKVVDGFMSVTHGVRRPRGRCDLQRRSRRRRKPNINTRLRVLHGLSCHRRQWQSGHPGPQDRRYRAVVSETPARALPRPTAGNATGGPVRYGNAAGRHATRR